MKRFEIKKQLVMDGAHEVLSIYIKHYLNKDQWKNRLIIFNSETSTYKNYKKGQNNE